MYGRSTWYYQENIHRECIDKHKCVEEKVAMKLQVSKLLDILECLSGELEEMRAEVATRDAKISQLKARVE